MESKLRTFVTVEQASRILDVHPQTVRNWYRLGLIRKLQPNPNGGKVFLRYSDVLELVGGEYEDE